MYDSSQGLSSTPKHNKHDAHIDTKDVEGGVDLYQDNADHFWANAALANTTRYWGDGQFSWTHYPLRSCFPDTAPRDDLAHWSENFSSGFEYANEAMSG